MNGNENQTSHCRYIDLKLTYFKIIIIIIKIIVILIYKWRDQMISFPDQFDTLNTSFESKIQVGSRAERLSFFFLKSNSLMSDPSFEFL